MKVKRTHLTLEERQEIYRMRDLGYGIRELGRLLGRSASTISRELKRNGILSYRLGRLSFLERAMYAHDRYKTRQSSKRRSRYILCERPLIGSRVLSLLEETCYSPEYIGKIISSSDLGTRVSGRSIRRWIDRMYRSYRKHFPHRGKRPRKCLTPKRKGRVVEAASLKKSIHDRPEDANLRSRLGDFELDLIVCSQSVVSVLSIRDRKSRRSWLRLVENRTSDVVKREINRVVRDIHPMIRHTLTFDRGGEFAKADELEKLLQMEAYFCDAYKAFQKGSVEVQNKEARRYLPKGTDLSKITAERLQRIEDLINAKPRDVLSGLGSYDFWIIESRKIKLNLH